VDWFKDKVLAPMVVAILLAILGALIKIYLVVNVVPDKFEDNKIQHERYDELLQQLLDKQTELDKRVLVLETKLAK
jgi:hypothetical protein